MVPRRLPSAAQERARRLICGSGGRDGGVSLAASKGIVDSEVFLRAS